MAKTVSSAGLQDFIATGNPTKVYPSDPKEAAKAAAEPAKTPEAEVPRGTSAEAAALAPKASEAAVTTEEPEEGLDAEDKELPERARKRIGKKHYEMKKAQEEAQFNERLAEQQYNERRLVEQERDQLKAELAKAKPAAPAAPALVKPKPDDFVDDQKQFKAIEYAEALAEYSAKKALADADKERTEKAAKEAGEAAAAAFTARLTAAEAKYPDFKEKIAATPVMLQNQALQYIAESEYGTDLAYYLADPQNKSDADRIKAMHPLRAIAELGKLETRFEKSAAPATPAKTNGAAPPAASPTVERTGAPAPITPLATSGSIAVVTDPAKMNFKQLRAYERQREAEKRRH